MVYFRAANCVHLDRDNCCRHPVHQRSRWSPLRWFGFRVACVFTYQAFERRRRDLALVCREQQEMPQPPPPVNFQSAARPPHPQVVFVRSASAPPVPVTVPFTPVEIDIPADDENAASGMRITVETRRDGLHEVRGTGPNDYAILAELPCDAATLHANALFGASKAFLDAAARVCSRLDFRPVS